MIFKRKKKGAKKAMPDPETTAEVVVDPPPFTIDPPFPVQIPLPVGPSVDLEACKAELQMQRDLLTQRVVELEVLLGFIANADDLAVRVAKLEHFVFGT